MKRFTNVFLCVTCNDGLRLEEVTWELSRLLLAADDDDDDDDDK